LGHMSQFTLPLIVKYFLCAFVSTIYRYTNINNNINNNNKALIVFAISYTYSGYMGSAKSSD